MYRSVYLFHKINSFRVYSPAKVCPWPKVVGFFFQIFFSLALCHTKKTKVNFCTLSLPQHNKDSSRYPQMLQLNTQNGWFSPVWCWMQGQYSIDYSRDLALYLLLFYYVQATAVKRIGWCWYVLWSFDS